MKTKTFLQFFICFSMTMSFGQTNVVYNTTTPTPNGGNVSVGYNANAFAVSGGVTPVFNTFIGGSAGVSNTTGIENTFIGNRAGNGNTNGERNVGLGIGALEYNNSTRNIALGPFAGSFSTPGVSGNDNIFIGRHTGWNFTGQQNVFLGNTINGFPGTVNNTMIFSDGGGNRRIYIHSNGYTGIGTNTWANLNAIPGNMLEIRSSFLTGVGASGLRLTNLTTADSPGINPGTGVLTVNSDGDVILVTDQIGTGGGITNSCTTTGYIPRVSSTTGNLGCSSIFDDGAGYVGFGYGTSWTKTHNVMVNGTFATGSGPYVTSDRKFKKDIMPIADALKKIKKLEGKTYFWKREEYKDRNFRSEKQFGLIAQDVEKIFPEMIIKSDSGEYTLNYTELIPVLIEALKEQQSQIDELKGQIFDNFKSQNSDLINLQNTKIISVSPNPSNDMIIVSFNIEESVNSAKLLVHDLNGNVISSLNIADRKNNITRNLEKNNFGNGIYIVSLVINGKSIDTKKIVFN